MAPNLTLQETVIVDAEGKLCFDLYKLYEEGWANGTIILATPNIPLGGLFKLRKEVATLANTENLDLDVIVATKFDKDGDPVETSRWRLGWDDGRQIYIHLFPKEFFDLPGANEVYENWVKMHEND